jgi:BNR repeat-like domain
MKAIHVIWLLVICVTLANAQAGQQTPPHQHGAMATGDGEFNPFVAADRRGGFYFVYVRRTGSASNVMLQHVAEGKPPGVAVRVNDREGDAAVRNENPPKVAVGLRGEVYVCWANERARWKGDIRFARSTDGGKTFSPALNINSDAGGEPTGHAFQSLAVDWRGRIFMTWIDERNKRETDRGAEIWMSVSEDGGRTFSPDRKILGDVCECCRTNIQVDSAGRLFLSYRTVPPSGPAYRDIIVASSADGGKTFSTTRVSDDGWEINACPVTGPALCVDKQDRLTVVWFTGGGERPALYFSTSSDHGKSFAPRRLLDADQKMGKHAQAVAGDDGRILVAWDDVTDKAVTYWGRLDPKAGVLEKRVANEGVTYPVIAIARRTTLIAGVRTATRELFLRFASTN